MKILFVGDASNLHNCLCHALRDMGHEAVVASDGSKWMDTGRDIDLLRRGGLLGTLRYAVSVLRALPRMRGFDVVEINGHIFLHLKPHKVKRVFDYLCRHNGMVVLSALGTDYYYYRACHDGHTFRYSDYMVGDRPSPYADSSEFIAKREQNWELPIMRRHAEWVTDRCAGVIACLWEYYATYEAICPEKLCYAGIPIDTAAVEPRLIEREPERVRFFVGIQRDRNVLKGTDLMLAAAKRVCEAHPDKAEVVTVENVPYNEYVAAMESSHVLLDQLYSYTPATNALLAMARGLVAVTGAEKEFYRLIGEQELRPIVNVSPLVEGDIERKLEWIVNNKHRLPEMSRQSREFVLKHNESHLVAQRHIDFLNKINH